jgi:hypothetical protein
MRAMLSDAELRVALAQPEFVAALRNVAMSDAAAAAFAHDDLQGACPSPISFPPLSIFKSL